MNVSTLTVYDMSRNRTHTYDVITSTTPLALEDVVTNVTTPNRDEGFAQLEIGLLATIFCMAVISNGKFLQ